MRCFVAVAVTAWLAPIAVAQGIFPIETWEKISDPGQTIFYVAGGLAPLFLDGRKGWDHALRTGDAIWAVLRGERGA